MADRKFNLAIGEAYVAVVEDGGERDFSRLGGVELYGLDYAQLHKLESLVLEFVAKLHAEVAPKQ